MNKLQVTIKFEIDIEDGNITLDEIKEEIIKQVKNNKVGYYKQTMKTIKGEKWTTYLKLQNKLKKKR